MGAISRHEWRELGRAQAALVRAQLRVWTRPTGQLVAASDWRDDAASVAPLTVEQRAAAVRVARAVRRASEYGLFRPKCLARSLALVELLYHCGLPGGRVRVGVQRVSGALRAHAWVEYGGRVLGDDPATVSAFAPLLDVGPGVAPP